MKYLRLPVQVFLYLFEGIGSLQELFVFKLFRLNQRTEYIRKGTCQSTGQCCQVIGIRMPHFLNQAALLRGLFIKWYAFRFNFKFNIQDGDVLKYSCNYLQPDHQCSIYRFRPKLCRDYPKLPYFGFTRIYKGCGYRFERRQ